MNQNEHEALAAIVEDMERDAATMDKDPDFFVARDLRSYARQINTILKMSKPADQPKYVPAEVQHHIEVEKARQEIRANKASTGMKAADFMPKLSTVEEEGIAGLTLVRGGPNHGMSVPMPPSSDPPGTNVIFANEVYTLSADRNFDYNEEETLKFRKSKVVK